MQKIELPIPEDNISPMRPDWSRLTKMLGIIVFIIISVYFIFFLLSQYFIHTISIEEEKELFGGISGEYELFDMNQLTHSFETPYNIYILDDEYEANAYALPGAYIYVTQSLLDNLQYEEELIFILGHEIEHIKNRDIIKIFARDIPLRLTLISLGANSIVGGLSISQITGSQMSQSTEKQADKGGIELINSLGLNLNCAAGFFERNGGEEGIYTQLFSSHPTDSSRVENIQKKSQYDSECTPLNY